MLVGCKAKTSPSHEGEVFVSIKTEKVSGGWGYKIYSDTTVYIDQPYIPVIPGDKPFPSEEDAKKTAELVMEKLKKQESPALDSADLVNLGLIKK